MSPQLKEEVQWWSGYLSRNKLVTIPLELTQRPPCVLYTDATGKGGTGAVLSLCGQVQWFRSTVFRTLKTRNIVLTSRETQVIPYEALAVLQAVMTFKHFLVGKHVVLFIDNGSVLGSVRKGRCRSPDVHHIIRLILNELESVHAKVHPFWVPSSLNIADVPSRGEALDFGTEVRCA